MPDSEYEGTNGVSINQEASQTLEMIITQVISLIAPIKGFYKHKINTLKDGLETKRVATQNETSKTKELALALVTFSLRFLISHTKSSHPVKINALK